jgi:hypothetical protein
MMNVPQMGVAGCFGNEGIEDGWHWLRLPRGWNRIKRQIEIREHSLGSLEDLALAHTGTHTHCIHRPKTPTDEPNNLQGTDADFDLALTGSDAGPDPDGPGGTGDSNVL